MNKIIIVESAALLLAVISMIYIYEQYSILKTESENFTNFNDFKIKMPVDSDGKALTIALSSNEYKLYLDTVNYYNNNKTPAMSFKVFYIQPSTLEYAKLKESLSWLPKSLESMYVVEFFEGPQDTVFNVYINPEDGAILKALKQDIRW